MLVGGGSPQTRKTTESLISFGLSLSPGCLPYSNWAPSWSYFFRSHLQPGRMQMSPNSFTWTCALHRLLPTPNLRYHPAKITNWLESNLSTVWLRLSDSRGNPPERLLLIDPTPSPDDKNRRRRRDLIFSSAFESNKENCHSGRQVAPGEVGKKCPFRSNLITYLKRSSGNKKSDVYVTRRSSRPEGTFHLGKTNDTR